MTCPHTASLIVTREVKGTSSSVAKRRVELSCSEPEGHGGPHRDTHHGESWQDRGDVHTHILRMDGAGMDGDRLDGDGDEDP
jgi:hypothetical protein